MFCRRPLGVCLLLVAAAGLSGSATAATVTWDPGLTGVSDGPGTWSTTTANWWNNSADALWSTSGTDTAVFGNGTAGTYAVTVANSVGVGGITFNPGTLYNISGGSIALGTAAATIAMNATSGTIGSSLTGASALTMTGLGMLDLNGTNTYSGTTMISGGTLELGSGGAGGTLGPGNIVDSAALAFNRSDSALTISQALSGAGAVTQLGTGMTTLSGSNITYTGATNVSSGTLTLQNTTAFGSAIAVGANGTLNLVNTATGFAARATIAGNAITGSGVISVNNSGTGIGGGWVRVNTATAMNFNGTINIYSGVFGTDSAGGAAVITGSATVNVFSGGVFTNHSSASVTIGALNGVGNVTPAQTGNGTYNLTLGAGNATGSFSGILHGNNSVTTDGTIEAGYLSLTKIGTGTQVLSGSNTYSAGTTVSGGTLVAANNAALGAGSVTLSPTAAATLDFTSGAPSILSLASNGAGTSTVVLGNGLASTATTLTVNNTAATTFGGLIGDLGPSATGALVMNGTGTLTLSGTSSYTGGTTINAGGLVFSSTAAVPQSGTILINSGGAAGAGGTATANSVLVRTSTASAGVLAITAANNETLIFANYPSLSLGSIGGNTFGGTLTPAGTTYRLGGGGGTLTLPGNLALTDSASTPRGLVINGNVTLTGSNTYSGPTTVTTGALTLGNLNAAQNSTVNVGVNNGLGFATGTTTPSIGALSGSGNVSLQDASSNPVTLTAGGNNATTTYTGALSGNGGLTKTGTGTLVITGGNSYAGVTTISQGTLRTLSGPITGLQTNFTSFGSTVNGYQDTFSGSTLNSAWQFYGAGSSSSFSLVNSSTGNFLHVTTDSGDPNHLLFNPGGSVTASNTWTVLALVQMNANFANNSDPPRAGIVAGAPTNTSKGIDELFRGTGTQGGENAGGQDVAMLSDGVAWGPQVAPSPVNWTTGTKYWMELTETSASATAKFWPANGTPETAASTVTWNSSTSPAYVATSGFAGITASSNGGALDMNVYYALIQNSQLPQMVAGYGGPSLPSTTTMQIASGATWDLGGSAKTVAGLTGVSGGYGNITLGASGALILNSTGASTFGGPISDSGGGSLVIGGGTLTLSGSDSYTGGTAISGGALLFGTTAAIPASGKITINSGGAAGGTGGVSANSVLAQTSSASTGALAITASNNETLVFTNYPNLSLGSIGNNTYGGNLTISGSTYRLGGGGGTLTYPAAITGSVGLALGAGPGTVVLTAGNNYSGPTTITAGSLMLGNLNAAQNSTVTVNANNGLGFAAGIDAPVIGALGGSGSVGLQDASAAAVVLNVGGNNATTTYSGVLSGSGGLATTGTGMLTLSGSSNYSGGTTISSGTLVAANNSALGTGAVTISPAATATLDFISAAPSISGLGTSGAGAASVVLGNLSASSSTLLTIGASNANTTFAGTIGDLSHSAAAAIGALAKTGTCTLTLSGSDSYTGGTTITGGMVLFSGSAAVPTSGAITISSGAVAAVGGTATAGSVLGLTNSASAGVLAITGADSETLSFASPNCPNLSLGSIGNNTFSGSLTQSGSTYRLGGGGGTLTFATAINGSAGLALGAGPGTVVLTASNNYSGPTVVNTGTLQLGTGLAGQDGSIGNTSGVTNNSALVYNLNGNQAAAYAVSGSGSLTKAGPGALTLTAGNTYSGPTVISGGTLQLGTAGLSGPDGSIASTSGVTNNAALVYSLSGNQSVAYSIGGSGSLTKAGPGTLLLTSSNTYSGPTIINGGTLKLQGIGYQYYQFQVNQPQAGYNNIFQISELAFYTGGTNYANGTRLTSGSISAYTGTYNTGEGPTNILAVNNPPTNKWCDITNITAGAPQSVTINFGTPQIFTGYDWATANDSAPGRNPNNWVVLGSSGSNGPWTVLDTETNAGNSPTTTETWAGGWVISGPGGLPPATPVSIAANATLDLGGHFQQVASLSNVSSGAPPGSGSIINSTTGSNSVLTLSPSGGSTTFSGLIAGGGTLGTISLVMNGAGTQDLSGSNTYTGLTTITSGVLQLGNSAALSTGLVSMSGGTLDLFGNPPGSLASLAATGGVVTDSSPVAGTTTLVLGQGAATTFGGTIVNGPAKFLALTDAGAGALTISGSSTYTGLTTVNQGATLLLNTSNANGTTIVAVPGNLQIGNNTAGSAVVQLGGSNEIAATSAVTFSGTTNNWQYLRLLGNNLTVASINDTGAGVIEDTETTTTGNATLTVAGPGNSSFSGFMRNTSSGAGTLALTTSGNAALSLSGGNIRYTGATSVSGGTLTLQDTTAFASAVSVGPSGTLVLVRSSTGFANRSPIAASAITGSGVIDVNNAGSGINGGWVIVNGATALNFTGTVNINSGVFATDNAGGVQGSATVNVLSGGVMSLHNASNGWTIGGLNGAGDVTPAQGTNGPTYTLTLGAANVSGAFSGIIHGNNSSAATDGSMEAGFIALVKTGTGTQILSGPNTYTGSTTINAGTLQLGNGGATGSLAAGSAITDNGNLSFNRSNAVTQGTDFSAAAVSGTGALVQAGAGMLTLNAANTYSGGTTITTGTLALSGGSNRLWTGGSITAQGGVLDLGGNGQTTTATVLVPRRHGAERHVDQQRRQFQRTERPGDRRPGRQRRADNVRQRYVDPRRQQHLRRPHAHQRRHAENARLHAADQLCRRRFDRQRVPGHFQRRHAQPGLEILFRPELRCEQHQHRVRPHGELLARCYRNRRPQPHALHARRPDCQQQLDRSGADPTQRR